MAANSATVSVTDCFGVEVTKLQSKTCKYKVCDVQTLAVCVSVCAVRYFDVEILVIINKILVVFLLLIKYQHYNNCWFVLFGSYRLLYKMFSTV